jgi:hypothetical protein
MDTLADNFRSFSADPGQPYTAVVVPSQSFDPVELAKIEGVAHYEERSLFNLMLLRHPRLEVIYVTSKRLNPLVVDYYLHQMRGVLPHHARARLTLLDCDDASPRPLTRKILERPRLVQRIKAGIRHPGHMVVFNSTPLERELARQLGVPLNACDPELVHLGSKTGSRELFRAAGLQCAPGRDGLRDVGELPQALAETLAEAPGSRKLVVKLNDSFSGEGNAILRVDPSLSEADHGTRVNALRDALPRLEFEASGLTWEGYAEQFDQMGGICESWIEGEGKVSPSTQLRINPLGVPQAVSTHDQVLGGPNGQTFIGATFPAAPRYRLAIQEQGLRVARVMAERGVIGRFGVDFLVVGDQTYAVEINLRAGGTTHPFNTLKFLTHGRYDAETGAFLTSQGRERCYFATDVLQSPRYRGILPVDLLDHLVVNGVHFGANETGVVFHLLGCLSQYGKLGCTAIDSSIEGAQRLYQRVVDLVEELAPEPR